MEQIRSFIAIELPDDIRAALGRLENKLKAGRTPSVKWVDPLSIHLTLKFLGSVDSDRIDAIAAAIEAAAQGISPFRLEVKGLGVFPNPRRVRVVWVGLTGDLDRLLQFQQRIEATVAPLGFPTEARTFSPHLTIARVRDEASMEGRQAFGELIAATSFEESHTLPVDSACLMKSQLSREGAIYTRLKCTTLQ